MIYGISYSDDNMNQSLAVCLHSMAKQGVNGKLTGYGPNWWKAKDYTDTFEWLNRGTLSHKRGGGYWLWKPWSIAHAIDQTQDGDILIYADAGIEFVAPVQEIINRMDQDIFFFTNGFAHVEWCKMDVLAAIMPNSEWVTSIDSSYKQVQASVIFFKVNQNTRNFVKEWLLWCQMPGFIDDSPSKLPNYPTFAEHRHDQAILTCLAIKHGYIIDHWWPTEYSMHLERSERDNYPCMFRHHRKRDPGKGEGVNPEW